MRPPVPGRAFLTLGPPSSEHWARSPAHTEDTQGCHRSRHRFRDALVHHPLATWGRERRYRCCCCWGSGYNCCGYNCCGYNCCGYNCRGGTHPDLEALHALTCGCATPLRVLHTTARGHPLQARRCELPPVAQAVRVPPHTLDKVREHVLTLVWVPPNRELVWVLNLTP